MTSNLTYTLLRSLALASSCAFIATACSSGGGSTLPQTSSAVSSLGSGTAVTSASVASAAAVVESPEATGPIALSTTSVRTGALATMAVPSGGTEALSDDFQTDAIGRPAAGWTVSSGKWSVCQPPLANHEYCTPASAGGVSFAGEANWSDYFVDALATNANAVKAGIALLGRVQDAKHFYQLELRPSLTSTAEPSWFIWRYNGVSWTELNGGQFVTHQNASYDLRLAFAGSRISAYVAYDGSKTFVPLGSGTDTSYASGKIGLRSWGPAAAAFDNVTVTPSTGAQPSPTPAPTAAPTSAPASGVAMYAGCPIFTAGDWYNANVTNADVDAHAANYIASITGTDNTGFYASTGIEKVNLVSSSTPLYKVHQKVSYHLFPVPYPVPSNPFIEPSGDDHYMALLTTTPKCHLYESYSTTFASSSLSAYSGVNYDLSKPFAILPNDQSSAMASGLSIFAGMVKYEELAGGIHHALNFSMFSSSPCNCYTKPASSADGLTYDGPSTSYEFPYGGHLRLKASFDDSSFGPQSKAIAEAMKHYGMFLADTSGHYSNNNAIYLMNPLNGGSWNGSDLSALGSLRFSDFDVLTIGTKTNR